MRDILFSSFLCEVWVVGMASGSTQANISVEWDVCESKGADPALLCTLIGCYIEATPASNSNSSASPAKAALECVVSMETVTMEKTPIAASVTPATITSTI
ncbi:hypothetical protein JZ751_007476 [Albula glossodonta]|uniref:Secreted protein n=1 Tax=Albula glossodonta TaxID=121402 RepID=A0A8T2N557_9TELE|nr:hypothetical protein JZ751_007476 [Albula glossodonta]